MTSQLSVPELGGQTELEQIQSLLLWIAESCETPECSRRLVLGILQALEEIPVDVLQPRISIGVLDVDNLADFQNLLEVFLPQVYVLEFTSPHKADGMPRWTLFVGKTTMKVVGFGRLPPIIPPLVTSSWLH